MYVGDLAGNIGQDLHGGGEVDRGARGGVVATPRGRPVPRVGPRTYCLPRHPTHFRPLSLELNGFWLYVTWRATSWRPQSRAEEPPTHSGGADCFALPQAPGAVVRVGEAGGGLGAVGGCTTL